MCSSDLLTGDRIDNIVGIKGIGPVKAGKLLKDCKTEQDLYEAVVKAYDGAVDRAHENGGLLWLEREEDQV